MSSQESEDIRSPLDLFKWDYKDTYVDGKHLHIINKKLLKFVDGDIENLALFIPPRHSKSMMASVYLPAYWMLENPNISIIQAGHSLNLVQQFVSHSRDIVTELSPYNLNESFQRMDEYKMGRPYHGHIKGVGVGSGITGLGAKVLIMDDLVKDAEAAFAPNMRKKLEDYYQGTLSSRLMPKGQKLLIMTRWHVEDISSRIITEDTEDDWEIIHMPAICEDETLPLEVELGRKEGDPLWPEFWPLEDLLKRRKSAGNYYWNASYQGNPIPPEGELLNPQGIQYYTRTPSVRNAKARIMAIDLAISTSARADETCVTILDVDHGGYYVEAQFAWRKDSNETEHEVSKLYNYWKPDSIYIESIGFQEVIRQNLIKRGVPAQSLIDRRPKEVKVGELGPHLDNGRIFLKNPVTQWDELINQISSFPLCVHDDRVESLWMAIKMAEKAGNPYTEGDSYYEGTPGAERQKNRRPSVFFDTHDNPYGISRSRF